MLQTSARLLRLLSLFQARRYWSGAELSQSLKVNARTLRRDVDRLRSLGYPVDSSSGVAGGYQLGAGAILPPLLLDDDEAVAVALGLRTSARGGVSGLEEPSVRALLKLEQVLPPRLRSRVAAVHGFVLPLETRAPTVDAERLSVLATACRDHDGIRFVYHDRTGSPSTRLVEPHRLVHTGYRWYLVAWDLNRKDWRTFRVDRPCPQSFLRARDPARSHGYPGQTNFSLAGGVRDDRPAFLSPPYRVPLARSDHHSPLAAGGCFPGA